MAQRTAGVRRHNAVRFSREAGAETAALTRLEFSRSVLQRGLGFAPSELNCVVKLPGPRDVFEVSFKNPQVLESFWNLYREKKDSMPLNDFVVDALTDREIKIVTIQFYNEAVAEYDVEVWLRRHCEILSESRRVNDEDGVWTGARRWQVRRQVEVAAIGGVRHLPSTVVLGANRGLVFYHGMPKLCRNCGALGHLAAACTVVKCKVCGGEHQTRACKQERACNLCGGGGHLFRNCPSSYANRARALGGGGERENQVEAPPKVIPQDGGREETILRSLIGSLSDSGSEVEAEGEWTVVAGKRRRAEKRSMGRGGMMKKRIHSADSPPPAGSSPAPESPPSNFYTPHSDSGEESGGPSPLPRVGSLVEERPPRNNIPPAPQLRLSQGRGQVCPPGSSGRAAGPQETRVGASVLSQKDIRDVMARSLALGEEACGGRQPGRERPPPPPPLVKRTTSGVYPVLSPVVHKASALPSASRASATKEPGRTSSTTGPAPSGVSPALPGGGSRAPPIVFLEDQAVRQMIEMMGASAKLGEGEERSGEEKGFFT
ncbi:ZCHC3 protein, partial [Amia calva]|nr:ZCHC3 protein [Amia calva]